MYEELYQTLVDSREYKLIKVLFSVREQHSFALSIRLWMALVVLHEQLVFCQIFLFETGFSILMKLINVLYKDN